MDSVEAEVRDIACYQCGKVMPPPPRFRVVDYGSNVGRNERYYCSDTCMITGEEQRHAQR